MSTTLDERARRHARARAVAASIIDAPRVARRFVLDEATVLRPSQRRRVTRPRPRRLTAPASLTRRRVGILVVAAQVVALAALLTMPAFRIGQVDVRGARLLSRDALLAAAQVSPSQSIFTVDGQAIQARLDRLPWVRSASVETDLPSTLRITVTEWQPVLELRRGGRDVLYAESGATVDVSAVRRDAVPPLPVLVDDRPAAQASGTIDPALIRTMSVVAQRFPAVVGCAVASFTWQADGLLTIVSSTGWKAILGYLGSSEQVADIPGQIAALAALRSRLDFVHPRFGYVDLENPQAPAVGGKPGPTTAAAPASAAPAPTASAAPTPAPKPTPTPAPTPITFNGAGGPTH